MTSHTGANSCSSTKAGDLSPGHRRRYFVTQTTEAVAENNKTRYSSCSCIEGPIDTRRLAIRSLFGIVCTVEVFWGWRCAAAVGRSEQQVQQARDCMKTDHLRSRVSSTSSSSQNLEAHFVLAGGTSKREGVPCALQGGRRLVRATAIASHISLFLQRSLHISGMASHTVNLT